MTARTVTATFATVCHYTFIPVPVISVSGSGFQPPVYVQGYIDGTVSPATLSVQLDDAWHWDVNLRIQGAPPVQFEGLAVGTGGDLFTLLTSSGWAQNVAGA